MSHQIKPFEQPNPHAMALAAAIHQLTLPHFEPRGEPQRDFERRRNAWMSEVYTVCRNYLAQLERENQHLHRQLFELAVAFPPPVMQIWPPFEHSFAESRGFGDVCKHCGQGVGDHSSAIITKEVKKDEVHRQSRCGRGAGDSSRLHGQ